MKKIIRNIVFAALVASPFSHSVLAESFSASAHGFTYGIKPAQIGKNNNVQPAHLGQMNSVQPVLVEGQRPGVDVDLLDLTDWIGAVTIACFPFFGIL